MEKITRTVTATTVQYAEAIVENGIPTFRPCGDEVIPGEITDQVNALQYLRKKYGVDRSFVVTGMTTDTKKYVMDLATFIATATPIAVVAKQDAPTDGEADADSADGTDENAEAVNTNADTVNPAEPAAPVINAPTNNPLPGSQAGVSGQSCHTSSRNRPVWCSSYCGGPQSGTLQRLLSWLPGSTVSTYPLGGHPPGGHTLV